MIKIREYANLRFRLIAFVCDGVAQEINDEGVSNFRDIFVRNYHVCRYAVVMYHDEVRAYDLTTTLFDEHYAAHPGDYRVFRTTDAAIVGCALLTQ